MIIYNGEAYSWDLGETGPAHIKAVSGHCVCVLLEMQLGWLETSKHSDIEPVTVEIYLEVHIGLREIQWDMGAT